MESVKPDTILSPRHSLRVVDMPDWYGGGWDLVTGMTTGSGKYARSPWAFACMNLRGSELANLPWRIVNLAGKILDKHPLIDMLQQFGDESNYSDAVQATEIEMLLGGRAYWLRDIDRLTRLQANTISIKANKSGIQQFIQTIRGQIVNRFKRDEIVYFREYHPETDLVEGTPVMEVLKMAISLEYESGLYMEAFFKNDATPSLLLSTEQTVAEPEMKKLEAWWNKAFRGARKARKVGVVDKGLTAKVLAPSMKEITMVELRDQARNDICVGFRVPKILVGSMVDSTYANAAEARKFMLEDVIIPRSKYYQDVINHELVRLVDPAVRFEFVPEQVQILQEGANEKWKRLSDALDQGVISLEFARKEMGWPETAAPELTLTADERILRSWQRKAQKGLKKNGSGNVKFETDEIPAARQVAIRAKLAVAKSADDIRSAFDATR